MLAMKKVPGKGVCPVKGCRKCKSHKQRYCEKHAKQEWRRLNPLKAAYATLKTHAIARKKTFTLTLEDFRAVVEPTRYLDEKGRHRFNLHIDRIVDTDGYVPGNIQILTCSENIIKENRRRHVAYFQKTEYEECPF